MQYQLSSRPWPVMSACRLAVLGSAIAAGCGSSGPERVAVAGTVMLDGQPLALGTVQFVPEADTTGPAAFATVKGGYFELPESEGPPSGTFRVEVIVHRDMGFPIDDDGAFARASQGGRRPLSPTTTAVDFRNPDSRQLELKSDAMSLTFDLVSRGKRT